MKRTLMVLAVFALVAFAGDFATGGAELTKFQGYGTFQWTMYGEEDINPANQFSDYVYMAWVPKINDSVDFCVSMQHYTTNADVNFDFYTMYLNMQLTKCLSLKGGQFKVPFGYAFTRSGGSMYFADRSMITGGEFGTYGGLDIGAMATVEFAPVTVDLMLSNGTGSQALADTTVNKQFTARLAVDPAEWLTIGGSFAMVGEVDHDEVIVTPDTTITVAVDAWSSTGMDFFAAANYPVTPMGTLRFVGEYMIIGAPDTADDATAGNGMSVMAGYDAELNGDFLVSIMPAVRYDAVTPVDDSGEAEDIGYSRIDFCVNLGILSNLNTLQIGMRNYGFQAEGVDGHTDIYANWRMNF